MRDAISCVFSCTVSAYRLAFVYVHNVVLAFTHRGFDLTSRSAEESYRVSAAITTPTISNAITRGKEDRRSDGPLEALYIEDIVSLAHPTSIWQSIGIGPDRMTLFEAQIPSNTPKLPARLYAIR